MKTIIFALALAGLAGPVAAREPGELDCTLGYAKLKAEIEALPGIEPNATLEGSPYRALAHPPSYTLFTFTLPGAPGHPAIVRRHLVKQGDTVVLQNSACGFGDLAGFEELKREFNALDARVKDGLSK